MTGSGVATATLVRSRCHAVTANHIQFYLQVPEQEYEDPFCVPGKPSVVQFADITSAAFKIRDGIVRTPCMVSSATVYSSNN